MRPWLALVVPIRWKTETHFREMMMIVEYQTGTPTETGVYACRVPDEISGWHEDIFLMWHNNQWSYLRSDQYYRGPVPYFVGPLRRRMVPLPPRS